MAAARALRSGTGAVVRLVGIGYSTPLNVDLVHAEVSKGPAARVMMESYNCLCDEQLQAGDVVPYRQAFPAAAVRRAGEVCSSDPSFRAKWTGEAVAVMTALHVGAEVRFCDRPLATSFARLVGRLQPADLPPLLFAASNRYEEAAKAAADGGGVPQNAIGPEFPELWSERHAVMAAVMRKATADSAGDVVGVVGAEHIDGVAQAWERQEAQGTAAAEALAAPEVLPELADPSSPALEVRCALAALLITTNSFPPELVLPQPTELEGAVLDRVRELYPQYRRVLQERLRSAASVPAASKQEVLRQLEQQRVHSLAMLELFMERLQEDESPSS
eukprot:TRINITY_DN16864_c0_g1_i1.p1 TRINITY_DN16864_c0_g1~~TRINITY_DN16864_c0_g1_i1.p1  ORF type:complete len:332 (+),score=101.57 TRINITY_DN16864_c0_g1_i1:104-1099(+)